MSYPSLRSLLALVTGALSFTATAHAVVPETLTYPGNSSRMTWAPYEGVGIHVDFSVTEILSDSSRPSGVVWRTSRPRPFRLPPQTGSQLDLQQTYPWSSPDRLDSLQVNRQAEAIDGRLVLRTLWQCEPTTGVFMNHDFMIDIEQHPEATLDTLLGAAPGVGPTAPLLSALAKTTPRFAPGSAHAEVNGVQISGIKGETLTVQFNETLTLSVSIESRHPAEIRLRFTTANKDIDVPFVAGAAIITAEWKPDSTP